MKRRRRRGKCGGRHEGFEGGGKFGRVISSGSVLDSINEWWGDGLVEETGMIRRRVG